MNTFLTVPITVREQIYHELLTYIPTTYDPSKSSEGLPFRAAAPSSPLCNLITLSRQINDEVFRFLRRRLCVVVMTNRPRFIKTVFDERLQRVPLISQLQSCDDIIKKDCSKFPIAMEWDLFDFDLHNEVESAACFLIPATSLSILIQNARERRAWTRGTCLSLRVLDTFSYTNEQALEILIHPQLAQSHCIRKFYGVITNDAITSSLTAELRGHLMAEYSAGYYLNHLEYYTSGYSERDEVTLKVRQHTMGCNLAHMAYECLFDCIRNESYGENYDLYSSYPHSFDNVLELWLITSEIAGELIKAFCHLAGTSGTSGPGSVDALASLPLLQEARKTAEEMIALLSEKPVCVREESLASDEVRIHVCKSKSLMSFRAHVVCKALGDVDGAIGYLEDAINFYDPHEIRPGSGMRGSRITFFTKFDSEYPENPVEKLEELKAERGTSNEGILSRVVRWEREMSITSPNQISTS